MRAVLLGLVMVGLVAGAAMAADPYTSPVDEDALTLMPAGIPLKQAESTLHAHFKLIEKRKDGTAVYKHWTTADHSAKGPFVQLLIRDGMVDTIHTGGIFPTPGDLYQTQ